MKRTKLRKILSALLCSGLLFSFSTTAFAHSNETESADTTETVIDRSETASTESNPLTVDGNGTLQDEADSSQDKIFYTVTTKNNNTFFLIIDKQRTSDNVYMLSMIDEADLADFIEENTSTADSALTDGTDTTETTPTETPEPTVEPETTPTEDTSSADTSISDSKSNSPIGYILLIILAVGAIAAYYVLKIRPKQDMDADEDENAYGGEEQPDEIEEADDTEESVVLDNATSSSENETQENDNSDSSPAEENGNVPFQDYPEVDDSDPSDNEDTQ